MKTNIYFFLLISICASSLFAQINDVPFKQATSVKYTLSDELKNAKFKKVVVDYNDIVYVLTDKGLSKVKYVKKTKYPSDHFPVYINAKIK